MDEIYLIFDLFGIYTFYIIKMIPDCVTWPQDAGSKGPLSAI